ncbi:hypothetical protein AGMMS50229_15940 [Campylobacterota bacterium]|nr:hypothetical protein AGMMS50229_15940 [Campylobacterota bacterium]
MGVQNDKGAALQNGRIVAADEIAVVLNDSANIAETLPVLFREQHEDVLAAESRLFADKGRGILFTNGTGTGKTLVGLGIAKRQFSSGKRNILIVAQSEPKINDWMRDSELVNLPMQKLRSIKDNGEDGSAVITTYANFRANKSLNDRRFDLIIYDESQSLGAGQKGEVTEALLQHRKLGGYYIDALEQARKDFAEEMKEAVTAEAKRIVLSKIEAAAQKRQEETKVIFLSASPFASHFAVRYADDFLFRMSGRDEILHSAQNDSIGGYNSGSAREGLGVGNSQELRSVSLAGTSNSTMQIRIDTAFIG